MLKMEPSRFLQVPGWEQFAQHDVKSCTISQGYINNNNNCNGNNRSSCSNIELTINGKYCCCSDASEDKYTAAIELSNKCREFYNSRLQAAHSIRSRWGASYCDNLTSQTPSSALLTSTSSHVPSSSSSSSSSMPVSPSSSTSSLSTSISSNSSSGTKDEDEKMRTSTPRPRNSIDLAMNRLRSEMMSLMEQDLSLMKQLLTLNETIEELKSQRQLYSCSTSCASLSHFPLQAGYGGSNWSVSDTEMYDSDDAFSPVRAGSPRSATATTPVALTTANFSTSGSATPTSASAASLVLAQHHTKNTNNRLSVPTWQSTRRARKLSSESDRISLLAPLSPRDGEELGLAAEVQAALRKMDLSAGRHGDAAIFPSAFVDSHGQPHSGKHKREAGGWMAAPMSPVRGGKQFQFKSDHLDLTPGPIIRHDRDQHSFDSGIHEPALSEEIVWNV